MYFIRRLQCLYKPWSKNFYINFIIAISCITKFSSKNLFFSYKSICARNSVANNEPTSYPVYILKLSVSSSFCHIRVLELFWFSHPSSKYTTGWWSLFLRSILIVCKNVHINAIISLRPIRNFCPLLYFLDKHFILFFNFFFL